MLAINRLKNELLVVFASCLENAKKKHLKFQLSKLGKQKNIIV